ncbi:peptidoglycan-binding protein [Streptomyces sp. NPDC016626]|uniref:peptidoglycan-binding protein n=1 Tax=Streptomyces sp. NPDC016626 TaxID=3364968 RepID=UPI0036FAE99B
MDSPVFEEFDPADDCDCPGCAHWRRLPAHARAGRFPGHPAARRTALAVAAVTSAAIGARVAPAVAVPHAQQPAGPGVPAGEGPGTTQGPKAPLHGPDGRAATPASTARAPSASRADIIGRARSRGVQGVPYGVTSYGRDGYRQDCSGHVPTAWNPSGTEWTGILGKHAERITEDELRPGDMPLFHHAADLRNGSHVVLFGGRTNSARSHCAACERTRPRIRRATTAYACRDNSARRVPYRLPGAGDGRADTAGGPAVPGRTPFPGVACFGPGAHNGYVAELGHLLVRRGAERFCASPPGPRRTAADRGATRAFQEARGWRGAAADGLPGPPAWELLVTGEGREIHIGASGSAFSVPSGARSGASSGTSSAAPPGVLPGAPAGPASAPSSHGVPGCPGRALFRPGAGDDHVTRPGGRLVRKGFGRHRTRGPGPRWSEADRRNVEAFQRARGRRGGAAAGHPGPETWRRLFS